jgi:two-component system nitrate/nitrite response regulator NarL
MGDRTATAIIEARSLVREALVSLMQGHSYHVMCSVASTADIDGEGFGEATPELVILGTLPDDRVAEATRRIRKLWPGTKIILLFDKASAADLQRLLASEVDACIPLLASPRTLIRALQLVVREHLRVVMMSDANSPSVFDNVRLQEDGSKQEQHVLVAKLVPSHAAPAAAGQIDNSILKEVPIEASGRGACGHTLSGREAQILKALVRGHSNKMIARMCSVTEATVKVHMKSILRKVRVANRTQAAIWALENSYFGDELGRSAGGSMQARVSSADGHVL